MIHYSRIKVHFPNVAFARDSTFQMDCPQEVGIVSQMLNNALDVCGFTPSHSGHSCDSDGNLILVSFTTPVEDDHEHTVLSALMHKFGETNVALTQNTTENGILGYKAVTQDLRVRGRPNTYLSRTKLFHVAHPTPWIS